MHHTSASSVQHPLFPLYVYFKIVPDNPFGVVILFYPLSSAMLLISIQPDLTSMLLTTFLCFLEWMKIGNANLKTLVVRCVLFAYALRSSVNGTEPQTHTMVLSV